MTPNAKSHYKEFLLFKDLYLQFADTVLALIDSEGSEAIEQYFDTIGYKYRLNLSYIEYLSYVQDKALNLLDVSRNTLKADRVRAGNLKVCELKKACKDLFDVIGALMQVHANKFMKDSIIELFRVDMKNKFDSLLENKQFVLKLKKANILYIISYFNIPTLTKTLNTLGIGAFNEKKAKKPKI